MTRRQVLLAVSITIALVLAADRLTERVAANSMPRRVMRTIAAAPASIDVLGIGNSLMEAGFEPEAIEQTCLRSGRRCAVVNGGLGASGVLEHLILTRFALRQHRIRIVVYGYFDQQLTSDIVGTNSEIIGNHNLLYYEEPEITLRYAPFDAMERWSFEAYRWSALLRERGTIWAKVEELRRKMSAAGMPAEETNRFGRKSDFSLLEAKDSQSFVEACRKVIASGQYLSAPARALLQQSRDRGARVIVVEMPVHPDHLRKFYSEPVWKQFRAGTRDAVERMGAVYLDASGWVKDGRFFADPLHLSKDGGRRFSEELGARLMAARPES